jgi:aminoglycoside phosphotransferase (APT) family kinase protein
MTVIEIHQGAMNFSYEIARDDKNYILKAYPPARYNIAGREFDLLKKAAFVLPYQIPQVCFYGGFNNFSYIIYEKIPGNALVFDLLNDQNKEIISSRIVNNLTRLFEMKFDRFGSLCEEEPTFSSWKEFLLENIRIGMVELKQANIFDIKQFDQLEKFMTGCLYEWKEIQYGFVWSDFSQDNIIINNNELAGFIDFESCFYGDLLLSLGYLFAREGESKFFLSIEKQLRTLVNIDRSCIYFYAFLRLLRISKYLLQPLSNGKPRAPVWDYFKGVSTAMDAIF